ncbi:hypothetical protein C1Y63_11690 [Corynebacterium sp. 13CS0277]|uniref:DUF2505 domain-containing protein n=1 Tax=Corynebacterium sp. 13CS0277 TaxID=2071994 RepID=UPI000D028299|nr:DUF2505 domain-containing protein [Corynebacterium sp. 13CS0277]PRQ10387.1 hypothetical protein C1Y63_11690 [Corynebacterium sp. 13CS0277]
MHFDITYTYPADIQRVLAMLADKEYRRIRMGNHVEFGALTSHMEGEDTVVISEMTPAESAVPEFARKIVAKGARVFVTERVAAVGDNAGRVVMSVTAKGVPVSADVTINLEGHGNSTTATVAGSFGINVPLVGRAIESKLSPQLNRCGVYESRAALTYLENHK